MWELTIGIGLSVAVVAAMEVVGRRYADHDPDEADDSDDDDPTEWDRLVEDEKLFLRSWAKHAKQ